MCMSEEGGICTSVTQNVWDLTTLHILSYPMPETWQHCLYCHSQCLKLYNTACIVTPNAWNLTTLHILSLSMPETWQHCIYCHTQCLRLDNTACIVTPKAWDLTTLHVLSHPMPETWQHCMYCHTQCLKLDNTACIVTANAWNLTTLPLKLVTCCWLSSIAGAIPGIIHQVDMTTLAAMVRWCVPDSTHYW